MIGLWIVPLVLVTSALFLFGAAWFENLVTPMNVDVEGGRPEIKREFLNGVRLSHDAKQDPRAA